MSNKRRGPSLYYASDKNIFDALTNRRVDKATLAALFATRNTIISLNSPREELAKYFSRLTHDYFDHKIISEKLGSVPRRERIATMEIRGDFSYKQLKESIDALKKDEEEEGNIIQLSVDGENVVINVQYTEFDYKLAEFSQVRIRDGDIVLISKERGHYVIRNTQNEYINSIKNNLLARLSKEIEEKLEKIEISLFSIQDVHLRSQFFYELISEDDGFTRDDVSRAYVYKAQPEDEDIGINEEEDDSDIVSSHIERVHLRGTAVTQSSILNDLTRQQYHIFRIQWAIKERLGTGHVYEIEAAFENPRDCINFSFILRGVYPRNDEDGSISITRRAPTQLEIEKIFNLIEDKAKKALEKIQKQASSSSEK